MVSTTPSVEHTADVFVTILQKGSLFLETCKLDSRSVAIKGEMDAEYGV